MINNYRQVGITQNAKTQVGNVLLNPVEVSTTIRFLVLDEKIIEIF